MPIWETCMQCADMKVLTKKKGNTNCSVYLTLAKTGNSDWKTFLLLLRAKRIIDYS